jgi:hypothetical protein
VDGSENLTLRMLADFPYDSEPRTPHRDEWHLDRYCRTRGLLLSEEDNKARINQLGHHYVFGTQSWSRGKHAWRVFLDVLTNMNMWIFLGVGVKRGSYPYTNRSFADSYSWGLSSRNQVRRGRTLLCVRGGGEGGGMHWCARQIRENEDGCV